MQYSPKLKKAMEEIKHILKRHDIAGIVILHDPPHHCEYLHHLSPSYSAVKINGDQLRIRAKLADFNGDNDKHEQVVHDTVNMIITMSDVSEMMNRNLKNVAKMLNDNLDIDTGDDEHTSHTTQNN